MRKESDSQKNRSLGISTSLVPWRLQSVQPLDDYCITVQFRDGLKGVVNLSGLITGKNPGVFSVLKDKSVFEHVYLSYGAVTWPGEIDLAPDAMYEAIKKHGEWVLG